MKKTGKKQLPQRTGSTIAMRVSCSLSLLDMIPFLSAALLHKLLFRPWPLGRASFGATLAPGVISTPATSKRPATRACIEITGCSASCLRQARPWPRACPAWRFQCEGESECSAHVSKAPFDASCPSAVRLPLSLPPLTRQLGSPNSPLSAPGRSGSGVVTSRPA